ncbi:MAG TPA: hypothetical protein VGO58_12055 [Chitinophagaceae bacterium]|jgi:hypothetical protein|nr:hypothetical protein [Chitinophagaceae bacterium]
MKKSSVLVVALCVCMAGFSQVSYQISRGEGIKLKKGTADLAIIAADNTGLYFTDERKGADVSEGGPAPAYTLYKLDKNFNGVFEKTYKKELKGLNFQSFQSLGSELFLFTTDYEKKDRLFKVYGAKIDKNSGELLGGFSELGSYPLETNRDNYEMKVSPIHNGSSFLMVSNISAGDRVSIGISLLDKSLKKIENTVINLAFDPGYFHLQDIQFTKNNKIVLLGKEYEEARIGKRKRTRLVFKQFVMSIYNTKGDKEKDVALNADQRYIISGKLIEQETGELLLAGFYSNAAGKTDLNGFFINRVDPEKGELLLSSFKEINSGMLGKSYADADDALDEKEPEKKAGEEGEEEEFPNSFAIKSVDINPVDNSIVITSEASRLSFSSFYTQRYNSLTRTYTNTATSIHRFITQDILLISADKNGNIKWLNALPKSQLEDLRTTDEHYATGFNYFYDYGSYFAPAGGMPFYSSYKSLVHDNSLVLLFNDHTSNNVNAEYGDRVKTVSNFRKRSTIYGVSVDLATGKMSRKMIAANDEETTLMPRHAFIIKNEVIIPSWRQHLMAKTELKFARISLK